MINSMKAGERVKNPAAVKKAQLVGIIVIGLTMVADKYFPAQFDEGTLSVLADFIYTTGIPFVGWAVVSTSKKIGIVQ